MGGGTTPGIDFGRAKARGLAQVRDWLPDGRQEGEEWTAHNPTRPDEHLGSFKVNTRTGVWSDFATGDAGSDAVSLLAYLRGIGQAEAARAILGEPGPAGGNGGQPRQQKALPAWILPVPAEREAEIHAAARADWTRQRYGAWAQSWEYRDGSGRLLLIRARYNENGGGKQVVPFGLAADGPRAGDPFKGRPAPLYNLPALAAAPADAPTLILEGERCADVAAGYLRDAQLPHIALTWPGGASAPKARIDWSPLQGRRVVLWPDKDAPGQQAAKEIAEALRALGCKLAQVEPPAELGEGGDIVDLNDAGWSPGAIRELLEATERPRMPYAFVRIGALELTQPDWLIRRYLERDEMAELFGDPGSCKSALAIDWSARIATGTAFRGMRVKEGPVAYIAGEGQRGIVRRFRAWQLHFGIDLGAAPLYLCSQPARLTDEDAMGELIESVQRTLGEPPAMVVLDTLARNFGSGDENATADMNAVISAADRLRALWRCAVLFTHHSGHGDKSRSRGASALRGALDTEYRLDKDEDDVVRVEAVKAKDGHLPVPLAFQLHEVGLGVRDDEGDEITSIVLAPIDYAPRQERSSRGASGKWQVVALEALRGLTERHRRNLENAGRDPDGARVGFADWKDACKEAGMPRNRFAEVRDSLRNLVREDGGYVSLS